MDIPGAVNGRGKLVVQCIIEHTDHGVSITPLNYNVVRHLWSEFDLDSQRQFNILISQIGLETIPEESGGTWRLVDDQLEAAAQGLEHVVEYCG